mmetsp:Transcript_38991/g.44479  ORF Transcript_38991/g.44479 Transcript_38991/m.44479 type:complete len:112 (+) Transcript_38991:51-386(+)|eukprot:CAMPEP_0194132398 /NCGR_PEP_ID=MMETSP0152-20130528/2888_1 /TAXON_ID=1049557 /ORGANISM="Thalassiothrix antarctica, Strain L6-D1" /LENGTH=111 /DNA_ID=CAMNT_0038827449 /DNA_START=34 /DNA_END=369 /DNA_ORIENTATION=+
MGKQSRRIKSSSSSSTKNSDNNSVDFQTEQYELHKKAFDAIIVKYNLKTEEKSTEISELLTNGTDGVNAANFAEKFGMDVEEAVVFLEWIKIGIKFKTTAVDTAKQSGFGK